MCFGFVFIENVFLFVLFILCFGFVVVFIMEWIGLFVVIVVIIFGGKSNLIGIKFDFGIELVFVI